MRISDWSSDVCSSDLDVGAGAARTDIAGEQQRNAGGAYVGGADRLLRLPHCPDEGRWPLLGQHLCHAPEVLAGYAADAFDLVGRIFLDLLDDLINPVDTLPDEFLVLPDRKRVL